MMPIPVFDPPPDATTAQRKAHWMAEARRVAEEAMVRTGGRPARTPWPLPAVPEAPAWPPPAAVPPVEPGWDLDSPADGPDWNDDVDDEAPRPWFADDGTWVIPGEPGEAA